MPLRQSATAAINAIIRRRIRHRARARYERRHAPGPSPRTTALIVASANWMASNAAATGRARRAVQEGRAGSVDII